MRISVVLPVLDEEAIVGDCLHALHALSGEWEIVVVDGGSGDDTVLAATRAGADRVLLAEGGRGPQMQAGAARASGEALLFLHADCRLPEDAATLVEETLADSRWSGGCFRVRHQPSPDAGFWTRRLVRIADRRSRRAQLPYGDQAVFTRRETYWRCGGVPALPLMEDLVFARRLRALGPIRVLPAEVRASARRFERRPWRSVLCWRSFPLLFRLGVAPERLARWYGVPR